MQYLLALFTYLLIVVSSVAFAEVFPFYSNGELINNLWTEGADVFQRISDTKASCKLDLNLSHQYLNFKPALPGDGARPFAISYDVSFKEELGPFEGYNSAGISGEGPHGTRYFLGWTWNYPDNTGLYTFILRDDEHRVISFGVEPVQRHEFLTHLRFEYDGRTVTAKIGRGSEWTNLAIYAYERIDRWDSFSPPKFSCLADSRYNRYQTVEFSRFEVSPLFPLK